MTFTERITLAFNNEAARRRNAGEPRLTKTELWKAVGATSAAATHWFSGANAMDLESCIKASNLLRVNPWWLYDESATMLDGVNDGSNVRPGPELKGLVPLISWVQAGDWLEAIDTFQPGDADEWLACPRKHGKHTFALRVQGVSMEPKYRDGAIIYVDPDRTADHLSNVIVRLEGEKTVTFKQLVIEENKKYLRPLNKEWPGPQLIEVSELAVICGVVIGQFIED